jgi:hypothetical protein
MARCEDHHAEVERWAAANQSARGAPSSITFHLFANEQGAPVLFTRSGGSTYAAVIKFGDGFRTAIGVGCGVGIDYERCFSYR